MVWPFRSPAVPPAQASSQPADCVHVVSPFGNAVGGSEWHALNLARALRRAGHVVELWCNHREIVAPFDAMPEIRRTGPGPGQAPERGNLVLVGDFWEPGPWFDAMQPRRIVQVLTVVRSHRHEWFRKVLARRRCPVEYVFSCDVQRRLYDLPGAVHPVPIDIDLFRPRADLVRPDRFVVGRLSRDVEAKHDFVNDPALYTQLLASGAQVRLMGAHVIRQLLPQGHPGLQLLAAGSEPAPQFLQGLDCLFFRTGQAFDTFAMVVFEAMACGLPVVVHRWGGYAEYLTDGLNAFLFDTQSQALDILARLQRDPALRERVGRAARATVETLYGKAANDLRSDFYASAAPTR